jgi:branched-chain amino acid transport system substrate-binding protein
MSVAISAQAIKVGLLFSSSSMTAAVEATQANATLLAIDEVNQAGGVNGVPLEAVTVPIGATPECFRLAAIELCDEHEVQVLFGTHMSSSRKAVLPVAESRRRLLFYPTIYEGFEYSPFCYYTGAAPNQNSVQLARYVLEHFGNRVVFIGVPYVYPIESNRIMRDLFEQSGGQVVDEIYLPFNSDAQAYREVMQRVAELAPDAIYSTVVGADIPTLYSAYAEAGFDPYTRPIVSLSTNEAEVALMPAGVAQGHICAAPWFDTLDNPASRHFVGKYRARFGADLPVTAAAEAAYFQVHLYAQAARLAQPGNVDSLREALGGAEFEAPQGRVRISPENHHTWLWPRIARLNAAGRFELVFEGEEAIHPSPYMIEHLLDEAQ